MSVFGLFFLGFSAVWVGMATQMNTGEMIGYVFPLFGMPFVLVGLWLVVGHWFFDAYRRKKTRYALTSKRANIARTVFGHRMESYEIKANAPLSLVEGSTDTVNFAEKTVRGKNGTSIVPIGFRYINDGRAVFNMLQAVKDEKYRGYARLLAGLFDQVASLGNARHAGKKPMSRRVGFDGGAARTAARPSVWASHLADNEEVLREGQPGFGVSLNGATIKTLVFVAVGFGILVPQILALDRIGSQMGGWLDVPVIGGINGVWFLVPAGAWVVLWGVSQSVITPFYTRCLLTDNRAYIAKTLLIKRIKSYEITPFKAIEYDGNPNGSVIFASERKRAENGKKRSFPVGFMRIPGSGKVYQMMVEIQRRKAQ